MNTASFIRFADSLALPYRFDGGEGSLLIPSTSELARERFNIGNRLAEELGAKYVKITSYADGSAIVSCQVAVGPTIHRGPYEPQDGISEPRGEV